MFSDLLSGLRSLRISLITGSLLVIPVYIFLHEAFTNEMAIKPGVLSLLSSSAFTPAILFTFLCLIVGSLYTTLLEGIVDSVHRKNVLKEIKPKDWIWRKIILTAFSPYSNSAKTRLITEVRRFYKDFSDKNKLNSDEVEKFVEKVMLEVLWMEGKLAGTVLESPYDKIRSEGELRVSAGLLLPITSVTAAFSTGANESQIILSILAGLATAIPTVNYGLYYYRKANSFLAHHIADGKILSPSMETLNREKSEAITQPTAQLKYAYSTYSQKQ